MDKLTPNAANSVPLTPLTFLERAAIVYGDSHSIVYDHISFTWSQTHRRCLQLASSLTSLGLGRGQVISVLSPNTPSMYELQFAVPMSGAILNNLNLRLDPHALSVLLRHSESKLVFVHSHSLPLILTTLSKFPHTTPRPSLVLITDDGYGDADAVAAAHAMDTYERLLSRGNPNFRWARPNSEWDPITLNYTSGTTASPKGVLHSHRATFMIALDSLIDWCVPKQPVYLWTLPMFHANGWGFAWGIAAVGGTNVCIRKTNAPIIYRSIESHNVTHMCAAPVVLNMLLTREEPLKNPVHVLIGGSTPPASVLARAEEVERRDNKWGREREQRGGGSRDVCASGGERGGGGGAAGRVLGGDPVRVCGAEGEVGALANGRRVGGVLQRKVGSLHGAEDGGVQGCAAEDADGEDSEARAEEGGSGYGVLGYTQSHVEYGLYCTKQTTIIASIKGHLLRRDNPVRLR
ncbi:acyl-activating enzyme 6 [Vigna angularis]|uniref:Acyl-activating enzyme 6 n=1 Tax=Phaseolus angularis TaxID=3914 RepID=A0A8T0K2U1_PHAAN|nr:acyl-activating enzyme 6 [Vigna angularis]